MSATPSDASTSPTGDSGDGDGASSERDLTRTEWQRLALLGLPTFGLALSITAVSTYLPTVAREFTASAVVIGVIIGGEGVAALLLPIVVGAWSDRLRTRWGGRLPFILVGTPIAVAGLVVMGVAGSLGMLAVAVAVFFAGYFIAYEPYRALYPDLIPEEVAGRGQSTQALWRGIGTGLALLGGGLLLTLGRGAPFLVAALVLLVSSALFVRLLLRAGLPDQKQGCHSIRDTVAEMAGLLTSDRPLRAFFFANALWELALAALKTFVVLWLTRGLGQSLSMAALSIGVAVPFILAGAALSGKLADRYGRQRVMFWAVVAFGTPMVVPLLTLSRPLIVAALPFIAIGGGVLMSLPYALLHPLMPAERHGALTGYYSVSRGLGLVLGPLLAGLAVAASGGILASTEGYAAMWAICGVATLASLPL
ncbi:MAG: MFS transporter, partial [Solirubrobacteraceae bacterium]